MRVLPLFGRPAPTQTTLNGYLPTPPRLKVLRADGQRIDLRARGAASAITATRTTWQAEAWMYRDLIGEARYAQRLRARAVARCRFYIAAARPWPEDPVPLDSDEDHGIDPQLAADAIANFNAIPWDTNPDGFTARLDENLGVAGEAWVHIDAEERFHVRSTSEIIASQDGKIAIAGTPNASAGGMRPLDPDREDLLRCWVPDPQWSQLADSPWKALLDVAEDVVLAGREQRAAVRSRLNNGILLVPEELTLPSTRDDDEDDDDPLRDTLMQDLAEALLAPVLQDGHAQATVPIVLRGPADTLEKVRHVTIAKGDPESLIARQAAALGRMLRGLDVQPEQVEGMGQVNHWGGWQIDARAVRDQVQPAAETLAACMMQAFMRPVLEAVGHTDHPDLPRLMIGVDVSPLVENPNRGQDARDAYDRQAISGEALRRELGFSEEDAPDDDESLRRLATSGALPVGIVATLLGLSQQEVRQAATIEGQITDAPAAAPAGLPAPSPGGDRPVAGPGQITPERPTPTQPERAPIVAAAEVEEWRVDPDASRRLADIDAALAERITVAADATLHRFLEKAGARVRSAAQKDKPLAASLAGVPAHLIPARLGRDQVEVFVPVADLIADGHDRLHAQVDRWLADAAAHTADAVCAVVGISPRTTRGKALRDLVVSRLGEHTAQAWPVLAHALDEAAEDALFDPEPPTTPGEGQDSLISPQAVIDALAAAGGDTPAMVADGFAWQGGTRKRRPPKRKRTNPGTGVATGPVVRQVVAEQGAVEIGWEWQYRPEILRATFDPHKQLDGRRFTSWRDELLATGPATAWVGPFFHPGDHQACRCTASPLWMTPTDPDALLAQALRDAHGDPRNILTGGTGDTPASALRDRVAAAVADMQALHIGRRGRR